MVSTTLTPSTPPPPSSIRTPHAPRLGFHDDWEPFSPRKSARLSAQRNSARTPSPPPPTTTRLPPPSPRTSKKAAVGQSNAAMTSPASSSPRKKRQTTLDSLRRVPPSEATGSGPGSGSGSGAAAAPSGAKERSAQKPSAALIPPKSAAMLPTPSKTPQKPPCDKTAANIKAFARNLFPSEETAISTPRKSRSKRFVMGEQDEEPIQIFTDSQDRIPDKDENESNPFYNVAQHESPRRSKRRQIMIPGEGYQSIDEASRRDDGMIYVFRGKKFFRKFAEPEDDGDDSGNDVKAHLGVRASTRSSIKPRLLFPVKKAPKTKEMLEEEETVTDIEEEHRAPEEETKPSTPVKAKLERAQTPEAPKFAPVSPPDTKRVTRSTNKLADAPTPLKLAKKKSPFDSWRRTKESAATPTTAKRPGEPLASANVKRTRA